MTDAVMQSAFRSAGQRCSALRLHVDIADAMIKMIHGRTVKKYKSLEAPVLC